MPTVLRVKGYRFFFFSLEGTEPPHIHVAHAERYAKIWLNTLSISRSKGFRSNELSEILMIVESNKLLFQERWNEHFRDTI